MAKAARKGPSEFSKLAQSSKYAKAWKDARKLEAGESFANPILPNGQYVAQVTKSQTGVTKKKELYWSLNVVITQGPHKGTTANFYNSLEPETVGDKGMTRMGLAVITAKRLGYEFDDAPSPADFEGIATELSNEKPTIQFSAANKEVEKVDKKTKRKTKVKVCNLRIERLLGDDVTGDEDDEEVVDDENEPEEEEEEEGDADADEGDEGADAIEKGDTVKGKLNGSKKIEEYLVQAVNATKGTATVKHAKTKTVVKDVPLDKLELVYED
jgi:hypothetical protein